MKPCPIPELEFVHSLIESSCSLLSLSFLSRLFTERGNGFGKDVGVILGVKGIEGFRLDSTIL